VHGKKYICVYYIHIHIFRMVHPTLTQTILEIKMLGRVFTFSVLKLVAIMALIWITSAFVFCSCCTYTLTDVIDILFEKAIVLFGGSKDVSIRVKRLQDKTCACKSPWYSPCVVWGSMQVKEDSCNLSGGCENSAAIGGAEERDTVGKCSSSNVANSCDKA